MPGGELLEYVHPRNDWLFLLISMAGGIALTVRWGYSGFTFAFWAIVASCAPTVGCIVEDCARVRRILCAARPKSGHVSGLST